MKRNLFFMLLSLLLIGGNPAFAQQLGRSEAATAEQRLLEDIGPGWVDTNPALVPNAQNAATIVQQGSANRATSTQNNPGTNPNLTSIMQVGDLNQAYVAQRGSGNNTSVKQNGDRNLVNSAVTGDNNTTKLVQNGDGNEFIRDAITNNTNVTITQDGVNNRLVQQGSQTQTPPRYEVEMRGNGINLTIEQGRIGQ
ncbi:hypothetical protein [Hymenobacter sediminicola]|uniref:Curlin associated repeat-containing protein n=1 Tax=Hymenobacter sediminicola TaxID=2761579 RepID=A0A7G7WB64_9BACT|nr:hypothetical protein [Hymenobacter sediminicola]QNH63607.1 hypothetical protein H4317_07380 [Hymenobacter sediminicola]